MREAPAREKKAMLTTGVRSARIKPISSCTPLLAASPLQPSGIDLMEHGIPVSVTHEACPFAFCIGDRYMIHTHKRQCPLPPTTWVAFSIMSDTMYRGRDESDKPTCG